MMVIIGAVSGVYEGNRWAKLNFTESVEPGRGFGLNVVSSKVVYSVYEQIKNEWEIWDGQKVNVYYDRFGRINRIDLADS